MCLCLSAVNLLILEKRVTLCPCKHPIIFHPFAAKVQEGLEQDEGHLTFPQSDIGGQPLSEERSQDEQAHQ